MQSGIGNSRRRVPPPRRGAVAIEMAVIAPILLMLALGLIDMGQFVNVSQVVSNASRVGGRMASRNEISSISAVELEIEHYIQRAFPNLPSDTIAKAVEVDVRNQDGSTVQGGNLDNVSSGGSIRVQVALQFGAVRWLNVGDLWNIGNGTITRATVMRRE